MASVTSATTNTLTDFVGSNYTILDDVTDHRGLNFNHEPWSAVAVIEGITMVIIFVVAFFANLMAMTTILTDKDLRKNLHNLLILNLTFMDMGVTITSMSFSIWSIYDHGSLLINNKALCAINGFGAALFTFGNFTTILSISLDRYLTVCWSNRFPPTKRRAIALVAFCWALPIINVIPPSFEVLSDLRYHPDTHHCSPVWDFCTYFIIWFVFIFGITVPFMAFCYINVIRTIRRQERQLRSHYGALKGNKSNALSSLTTPDSGIGNMSKDNVNSTKDEVSDGTFEIDGAEQIRLNSSGTPKVIEPLPDDQSYDMNNQLESDDEETGEGKEGSDFELRVAGKPRRKAKSMWNARTRVKTVLAGLNELSADKQVAITGMMLVFTTLVCWTPYFIIYSCFLPIDSPHWLGVASMWLGYTNSLLDPLVYAFMNRRLRARYRSLIGYFACARNSTTP